MPPEVLVDTVCRAFGCTPAEALKQDWALVRNILEWRSVQDAKEKHNVDVTKLTPGQAQLWAEMIEASTGAMIEE